MDKEIIYIKKVTADSFSFRLIAQLDNTISSWKGQGFKLKKKKKKKGIRNYWGKKVALCSMGCLQLAEGVHMPVATDIAINQSLSLKEEAITNWEMTAL